MPPKSLDDWLEYISSSHPSEIELGLDRVSQVWSRMGAPALAKLSVVVSGTNGKGSTAFMLARLLSDKGYRAGVYSSPHISRYNERVQLAGRHATDAELIGAFERVERARSDVPLTYFEFGTLAALTCLADARLDVAILEVGLGGRLDAVNIVDADLAIVTSVALDHVDWLGDDIQQIGLEKAGVMRSEGCALLGENLPSSVAGYARKIGCSVKVYGDDFRTDGASFFGGFPSRTVAFKLPSSELPVNNIALAAQAFLTLDAKLDLTASRDYPMSWLFDSLSSFSLAGRMERLPELPHIYLDVCHNPHAALHMASVLDAKPDKTVVAVFSALEDKDVSGVVEALASVVDLWLVAPLNVPRAATIGVLESAVGQFGKGMLSFDCLEAAMRESLRYDASDTLILVFGSFFVVEAAKEFYIE